MNKTKIIIILIVLSYIFNLLLCETQAEPPSNFNDSNAGSANNPYLISNLANLRWLKESPSVWSRHFLQTADIDSLETIIWNNGVGIGEIGFDHEIVMPSPFRGTYDGDNYSIFNLYKNRQGDPFWAARLSLFGFAAGANFKNIRLLDINFNGSDHWVLGGLVYEANFCKITNVSISGNISLTNKTHSAGGIGGSLLGIVRNTTVENCASYVNIVGNNLRNNLGGLIWILHDTIIKNSYFHGNIKPC